MNTTMTADQAKNASREKRKPFCKVCFDAGKSEELCTSHYLKSNPGPDGKVVCPTLLNQACLTCGKKGHTSSYCREPSLDNKLAKKWHDQRRETLIQPTLPADVEKEIQMRKKAQSGVQVRNSFNVLVREEKEEEIDRPQTMAERLKAKMQQPQQQAQAQVQAPPQKLKLPEHPPKSQFWWQDEDD